MINRSVLNNFTNICKIAYGRRRYIKEFIVHPSGSKMNEEILLTVLRTGNEEPEITSISAYVCTGYIPNTSTLITKYRIAAGPKDTSVILLRETDCPYNMKNSKEKCYEIIELIEYLSFDYVNFFLGDN